MKNVSAQGADLRGAKLQGVQVDLNKPPAEYDFTELIESFTDRDTNLDGVVFKGGLTEQDVDAGVDGLSADAFPDLREHLADAVGPPPSHDLPAHSGAEIGRYSFEEARCWIRDYRAALLADPPSLDPGRDPRP